MTRTVLAADSNPFQPGVWTLVIALLLVGLAVLIAMKDRRRRDTIKSTLDGSAWTAECLDPGNPNVRRMLVVSDASLSIIETSTRETESYPWAEVGTVSQKSLRSRLQNYPGIQLSLLNGHARDLLVVAAGHGGRRGYQLGAAEAELEIRKHLKRARAQRPEDPRTEHETDPRPPEGDRP